jgi:hypothetical protein
MQNFETQDIQGTTSETMNPQDVPTVGEQSSEPIIVDERPLDAAGFPEPFVVTPEEEAPAFADEEQVPNVMLAGKGVALAEGPVIIGRTKIILPNEESQKAGFYTEHAGLLVGQYPQYKFKREKGDSKNVPNVSL